MSDPPKRPRDANQLAKMIVDIAVGDIEDTTHSDVRESEMAKLGREGGRKGGVARAKILTAEQRREIAQRAAAARWRK